MAEVVAWRELIRLDYKVGCLLPVDAGPTAELPRAAAVLEGLRLG